MLDTSCALVAVSVVVILPFALLLVVVLVIVFVVVHMARVVQVLAVVVDVEERLEEHRMVAAAANVVRMLHLQSHEKILYWPYYQN